MGNPKDGGELACWIAVLDNGGIIDDCLSGGKKRWVNHNAVVAGYFGHGSIIFMLAVVCGAQVRTVYMTITSPASMTYVWRQASRKVQTREKP